MKHTEQLTTDDDNISEVTSDVTRQTALLVAMRKVSGFCERRSTYSYRKVR
jgi:hypothetical protein